MKKLLSQLPLLGSLIRRGSRKRRRSAEKVGGSSDYWKARYEAGRNSGKGSYNQLAEFKAEILNQFVREQGVETVIEYGCGDGNQLKLINYPSYIGFDISPMAISLCNSAFAEDDTKSFREMTAYAGEMAQLAVSLDVVYHLVEDSVFEAYMQRLFDSASKYVIIYSSDSDDNGEHQARHVRHRKFTHWVSNNMIDWKIFQRIPNRYPYSGDVKTGSFADFYIYAKI